MEEGPGLQWEGGRKGERREGGIVLIRGSE